MKSLKCRRLILSQSGVAVFHVKGTHHCGLKKFARDGKLRVKYEVRLVCAPSLDGRGFLYDQSDLRSLILDTARKPTELSCEALAKGLPVALMRDVRAKEPTCRIVAVHVKLSPRPYKAAVEAVYGKE